MIRHDVWSELVLRNRDTDEKVSVALSAIFLFLILVVITLFLCIIVKKKDSYMSVTKFVRTFVVGMKEKRFKSVLFYYIWFFTIRMLLAVCVVLIGIVDNIICASIFLGLVLISFFIHCI